MRKIIRKIGIVIISLAVMATVGIAPVFGTPRVDIDTMEDVLAIVNNIISWAFIFFFALAALFILWAGFTYLTGGGSESSTKSAKQRLMYAAIGIIIALVARGVVAFIQNFLAGPIAFI